MMEIGSVRSDLEARREAAEAERDALDAEIVGLHEDLAASNAALEGKKADYGRAERKLEIIGQMLAGLRELDELEGGEG